MKSHFLLGLTVFLVGCSNPVENVPVSEAQADQQVSSGTIRTQSSDRPIEFKPDVELSAQLGDPVQIVGYTISPPKGYAKQQPNSPPGMSLVAWAGSPRPDGTSPSLQLLILTPPSNENVLTIDEAMNKMLAAVKQKRVTWTETETTYGLIGGIKFARKTWTGIEPRSGQNMTGVMYVGADNRSIIQLSTQDLETHADALKLSEAALLTFSKK